jgi:HAD superfamily hydrolase (TIGR01509 family)
LEKVTGITDQNEIKRIWEMAKDPNIRAGRDDVFKFPEKLEATLTELHKKYKLAVVTSRIQAGVDEIFKLREIKQFFDVVVKFEDYKNPKPHPEPLQIAITKLGIEPNEAIYVGDSHTDIEAAQAAGTKSIHLASEKHNDADIGIDHFDKLVEAIAKISNP